MLELLVIVPLAIAYFASLVVLENSTTRVGRAIFFIAMIPVAPFLIAFYAIMWVVEPWLMRSKCPACGKRQMVIAYAVRANPPRPTLYLCLACGARRQRLFSGPWYDASDAEFDEHYSEFEECRRVNPSIYLGATNADG
jgi:DNA-directed RNA polymerase subunit RPC12/RpoP